MKRTLRVRNAPDLHLPDGAVCELTGAPAADDLFPKFAQLPHCVFFDSALRHPELGRYSFLTADPCDYWELPPGSADPFGTIARRMHGVATSTIAGLPPFQGGVAGLFGYELGRSLERLAAARWDEFTMPALAVGLYDVVLAYDHLQNRCWAISQGWPEADAARRRRRAAERMEQLLAWIREDATTSAQQPFANTATAAPIRRPLASTALAPQFDVSRQLQSGKSPLLLEELTSNFTSDAYCAAVRRVIDYICAGDAFQVNLSQRLLHPAIDESVSLYLRLRQRNPATFAGYFDLGEFQVCRASPERFLQVRDRHVEARPIKGTRARTAQPEADLYRAADLQLSEKIGPKT